MKRSLGLSKSRITAFEQCPKRLWLSVNRPELGNFDTSSKARLASGNDVGTIACNLHPDGVMVEAEPSLAVDTLATKGQKFFLSAPAVTDQLMPFSRCSALT